MENVICFGIGFVLSFVFGYFWFNRSLRDVPNGIILPWEKEPKAPTPPRGKLKPVAIDDKRAYDIEQEQIKNQTRNPNW